MSWLESKSSTTTPTFNTMAMKPRKELSQWDKGRIEGRSVAMTDTDIGHELQIPVRGQHRCLGRTKPNALKQTHGIGKG